MCLHPTVGHRLYAAFPRFRGTVPPFSDTNSSSVPKQWSVLFLFFKLPAQQVFGLFFYILFLLRKLGGGSKTLRPSKTSLDPTEVCPPPSPRHAEGPTTMHSPPRPLGLSSRDSSGEGCFRGATVSTAAGRRLLSDTFSVALSSLIFIRCHQFFFRFDIVSNPFCAECAKKTTHLKINAVYSSGYQEYGCRALGKCYPVIPHVLWAPGGGAVVWPAKVTGGV